MIGNDGKMPVRQFPIPVYTGGKILVTFPDGSVKEVSKLAAATQADLWWAVVRAAAINGGS